MGQDLQSGAEGRLGTTGGIIDDGRFVATVRFDSAEAARRNSERPEQGAWWAETEQCFDGPVTFLDCPQVDVWMQGGSDDAGFVQVISGGADRSAVLPVASEVEEILRRMRPDVIGGIVGWPGDGTFTQVVYFTSEEEARAHEGAQPSAEDKAAWERLSSLMSFDRFLDLPDPWLYSRDG